MNLKKIVLHSPLIPVILLLGAVSLFIYITLNTHQPPEINSFEPAVGLPGDTLIIKGSNFGNQRGSSEVSVAGKRPTLSEYLKWSDSEIHIRVPENIGSGNIFVRTQEGASNSLLFTNRNNIPIIISGSIHPTKPHIKSVEPKQGSVGTEILITGYNFGREQNEGEVYFTFDSDTSNETNNHMLSCSAMDYNYISWDDKTLRITVPDGAISGNIFIKTDRGDSNNFYFEVNHPVGTKQYTSKRGYQISYGIELSYIEAEPGSYLDFWVPMLNNSLEQRNIEALFEPEPMWVNYNGLLRYHFSVPYSDNYYNDNQMSEKKIITYWFDRYSVETDINHNRVPTAFNQESKLYKEFTKAEPFLPKDEQEFINIANALIRNERNPFNKAENIYNYVLRRLEYNSDTDNLSVSESVSERLGDAFHYAFLFVTLCRSAGIPARPAAGYFVHGDKIVKRHWWAEFYLESFGWVPVDPALGDGGVIPEIPNIEDTRAFFFGNITNQHILFSRGIVSVPQLNPDGATVHKDRSFGLQTLHEESSPGVREYHSNWRDIEIVDWW